MADLAAGGAAEVVVTFGRELAHITSLTLLSNGVVTLAVTAPAALEEGVVTGSVKSLASPMQAATFLFEYHAPAVGPPEKVFSTPTPTFCFMNEAVTSHVTLRNIDPKPSSAFAFSPAVSNSRVSSTWEATRVAFDHMCAGTDGGSVTTTVNPDLQLSTPNPEPFTPNLQP